MVTLSGGQMVIDGLLCNILPQGVYAVSLIPLRLSHRYVLFSRRSDAICFCQARGKEKALATYQELETGDFLVSWYFQTEWCAFNVSAPGGSHFRRICVGEIISNASAGPNHWATLRITHDWGNVRTKTLEAWLDACQTMRRLNQYEEILP